MANQKNQTPEQDFPGYPHYSPKEDIMNNKDIERVDADVENLSRYNKITPSDIPDKAIDIPDARQTDNLEADDEVNIVPGTDADLTKEDLVLLGDKDADFGRKNELDNFEIDEAELDIPGSETDDKNEEIGEEDEENNYYSLGGDNHENLEENQG